MSATLAESIAWDCMSDDQKRANAAQLVPAAYYGLTGGIGTAVLRCLDAETSQFRVISHTPTPGTENLTDWLVTLDASTLAKLSRISAP